MDIEPQRRLVTLGRMARLAGVRSDWLRSECEADRLPHLRAGDRFLFNPDAVLHELAQRAAMPANGGRAVAHANG